LYLFFCSHCMLYVHSSYYPWFHHLSCIYLKGINYESSCSLCFGHYFQPVWFRRSVTLNIKSTKRIPSCLLKERTNDLLNYGQETLTFVM
jgi:hypothetical protein